MSSNVEVVSVVFHHIFPPRDVEVPLAQAWDYWDNNMRTYRKPGETGGEGILDGYFKAKVRIPGYDNDKPFETFAKAWMAWDFEANISRLVRIGLGAYGDGGPTNPSISKGARITQHYIYRPDGNGDWVSGINWEKRDPAKYPTSRPEDAHV